MAAKSSSRGSAAASEIRVLFKMIIMTKKTLKTKITLIEKISSEESVNSQELEETPQQR